MHVVMISDLETIGGAAVAASRLATGLVQAGHGVTRIVSRADGTGHPWQTIELRMRRRYGAASGLLAPLGRQDQPLRPIAESRLRELLGQLNPDVVNLHNLHGAFAHGWSARFASVAASCAPTMWTLHDMWSFTGRCAYNGDCRRFETGCNADCPTPEEYPRLRPSRIAGEWQLRKERLTNEPQLQGVSPSQWLAEEAASGAWPAERVSVIPYGLPLDVFRPLDRRAVRNSLHLPKDASVLVMAAPSLRDPRKGWAVMVDAIARTRKRPLFVLTLGHAPDVVDLPGVSLMHFGFVSSDRLKAIIYSAADVLVHPALADNFPLVVQESLACGTPTVAFAVGGLVEMVRPGLTGWLADGIAPEHLANAIDAALATAGDLRATAREVAESEWQQSSQAVRYAELANRLGATA